MNSNKILKTPFTILSIIICGLIMTCGNHSETLKGNDTSSLLDTTFNQAENLKMSQPTHLSKVKKKTPKSQEIQQA